MAATTLDIRPVGAAERSVIKQGVNDWQGRRIIQRITVLGDSPTGVGPTRWGKHVTDVNGASDFYGMSDPS